MATKHNRAIEIQILIIHIFGSVCNSLIHFFGDIFRNARGCDIHPLGTSVLVNLPCP